MANVRFDNTGVEVNPDSLDNLENWEVLDETDPENPVWIPAIVLPVGSDVCVSMVTSEWSILKSATDMGFIEDNSLGGFPDFDIELTSCLLAIKPSTGRRFILTSSSLALPMGSANPISISANGVGTVEVGNGFSISEMQFGDGVTVTIGDDFYGTIITLFNGGVSLTFGARATVGSIAADPSCFGAAVVFGPQAVLNALGQTTGGTVDVGEGSWISSLSNTNSMCIVSTQAHCVIDNDVILMPSPMPDEYNIGSGTLFNNFVSSEPSQEWGEYPLYKSEIEIDLNGLEIMGVLMTGVRLNCYVSPALTWTNNTLNNVGFTVGNVNQNGNVMIFKKPGNQYFHDGTASSPEFKIVSFADQINSVDVGRKPGNAGMFFAW